MYYGVEMKKWEKPVGGELLFSEYAYKLNANAQYTYNQSFTASSDGVVSISCSAFYSYISKQLSYNIVTVTVNGVEIPTITLYDYDAYATGGNAKTLFEVRKYDTVTIKYTAYMINGNSGYCYVSYNGYLFKGLGLPDIVNVGSFTNTASSSWNITQKDDTIFTINDDKSITILKEGSIKINFKPVDSGAYGDIYKNGTQYLHFRNSGGNGNTELVVDVVEGDIITLITGSGQTISDGKITFWCNEGIEDNNINGESPIIGTLYNSSPASSGTYTDIYYPTNVNTSYFDAEGTALQDCKVLVYGAYGTHRSDVTSSIPIYVDDTIIATGESNVSNVLSVEVNLKQGQKLYVNCAKTYRFCFSILLN